MRHFNLDFYAFIATILLSWKLLFDTQSAVVYSYSYLHSVVGMRERTLSVSFRSFSTNSFRPLQLPTIQSLNKLFRMPSCAMSIRWYADDVLSDFSLHSLQDRMRRYVEKNLSKDAASGECPDRLVLAISGGGGHFISTLSSTPGASSILLEGSNLYDRESYGRYVGLSQQLSVDGNAFDKFKYCSPTASSYAAKAALRRSLDLTAVNSIGREKSYHNPQNLLGAFGVGCTSALVTASDDSSRPTRLDRVSKAYIVVNRADGNVVRMNAELASHPDFSTSIELPCNKRSRFDEDVVVSHLVLTCIELVGMGSDEFKSFIERRQISDRDMEGLVKFSTKTPLGDKLSFEIQRSESKVTHDIDVRKLLERKENVMVLIPYQNPEMPGVYSFKSLMLPMLPPKSMIVPGSFNPPHRGHIGLADLASKTVGSNSVWFELSITNVDKAPLSTLDVSRRLQHFLELASKPNFSSENSCGIPFNWGVLLTDAPLFAQKVKLLTPLKACANSEEFEGTSSMIWFCIGSDTLLRLLDKKYYSDSESEMFDTLTNHMPCNFVVGGRVEQGKDSMNSQFITGEESIQELPTDLQKKFTLMTNFRIDTSSSELRREKDTRSVD